MLIQFPHVPVQFLQQSAFPTSAHLPSCSDRAGSQTPARSDRIAPPTPTSSTQTQTEAMQQLLRAVAIGKLHLVA